MQVTINNELTVEVVPNEEHEWLLSTKDVAEGYGLSVSAVNVAKHRNKDELEEGEHFITTLTDRNSGAKTMWTKAGVVMLGMFIKTPIAKEFRRWATKYIVEGQGNHKPTLALPDFTNPAEMARAWAEQYEKLQLQAPKVETFDAIMSKETTHGVRDAANIVGIKSSRVQMFLCERGYIYKLGRGSYKPYAKYASKGYFDVKLVEYNEDTNSAQLRFTANGINLLRSLADEYDVWHRVHYGTSGYQGARA